MEIKHVTDIKDGHPDSNEAVNERLNEIANELAIIYNKYHRYVRPYEAALIAKYGHHFANCSADAAGNSFLEPELGHAILEEAPAYVKSLDNTQIAKLLTQIPITREVDMTDPDFAIDQHLAVDVAAYLGPDWAQTWYRFITTVTKLT